MEKANVKWLDGRGHAIFTTAVGEDHMVNVDESLGLTVGDQVEFEVTGQHPEENITLRVSGYAVETRKLTPEQKAEVASRVFQTKI